MRRTQSLIRGSAGVVACVIVCAGPAEVSAQYRLPLDTASCEKDGGSCVPTAFYDNAGFDWAGGTRTYADHRGTDFAPSHDPDRDVYVQAAADGWVVRVENECPSTCADIRTTDDAGKALEAGITEKAKCIACGDYFGNRVMLLDRFGRYVNHGHMRRHSVPSEIKKGTWVSCNTRLGIVAASGHASGDHVDIEIREFLVPGQPYAGCTSGLCYVPDTQGRGAVDPFAGWKVVELPGAKPRWVSLWTDQRYYSTPGEISSVGLPNSTCHSCPSNSDPGRFSAASSKYADGDKGYRDVSHRFQHAYGYTRYLEDAGLTLPAGRKPPQLGCPGCPAGKTCPYTGFVHDVGSSVLLQDFTQTDTSLRFLDHHVDGPGDTTTKEASTDGWTAVAMKSGGDNAYLLRSGFWGTYKCLTQSSGLKLGSGGGAPVLLGAPTSSEYALSVSGKPTGMAVCGEGVVPDFHDDDRWRRDEGRGCHRGFV